MKRMIKNTVTLGVHTGDEENDKNSVTPGVHTGDEENGKEHSHPWGTCKG